MADKLQPKHQKVLIQDINLTSLGWELALPIFGCTLIGHQIGQSLSIRYLGMISGVVLGIGVGYFNLYRHIELELLRLKASKIHNQQEESSS